MYYRDTWIEVNLSAMEQNIRELSDLTKKELIMVVKANAYGHGDLKVAKFAQQNCNVSFFAVSSMDEATFLRSHLPEGNILILGYVRPGHLRDAIASNITVTIPSLEYAGQMEDCTGLHVHIKVDTGMNRLGCRSVEEVRNVYSLLTEKGCIIDGIFSHYTSSDCDMQQTLQQQEAFRNMVKELPYTFRYVHMDNTDGAIDYPDDFTNAVRIGLGVYGVSTTRPLHPVLSFYTRVAMCKKVEANQTISYSCTYTTKEEEWICTLPVGYADGWLRKHQGRQCYVNGHYVPFVGRICMDQCMIHVPGKMKDGTVVELIGPHIPLVQVARELDTIPYEILCTLSDRIVRTYTYNNEYISEELFRY